jgi:hypothetical protein
MKRVSILLVMLMALSILAFGQFDKSLKITQTAKTPSMWPQVAFGPDGILHIVWVENWTSVKTDVMYTTFDGVTVAEPIKLTGPGTHTCFFPFIAMNGQGQIAVIWAQSSEHWMASYDPGTKTWSEPELVAGDFSGNGFLSRPKIALDEDGNIYTFFFGNYKCWSRSKINGVWEGIFQLNGVGVPAKEGGICAAPDGWIYVIYDVKLSGGDYKVAWRKRTKDTKWTNGGLAFHLGNSQEQPYVGVGLNSIPYVTYLGNDGKEGSNVINLGKMTVEPFPAEAIAGPSAFHYPRVVTDNEGHVFVATQYGQGDHSLGIQCFYNVTGTWQGTGILPQSQGWPKLPGIASDAYGNVAISYDSITDGLKQVYITTRYPVEVKHFYPPVDTTATVSYSGIMSGDARVTFTLSWAKNPENNDNYIRGYKIYQKVGDGDWELALPEVGKDTLSVELTYEAGGESPLTQKTQFAVATVSVAGFEGDRVTF